MSFLYLVSLTDWLGGRAADIQQLLAGAHFLSGVQATPTLNVRSALQKRKDAYIVHNGAAEESHWPPISEWMSFDRLYILSLESAPFHN
jgi:hypothetical protein